MSVRTNAITSFRGEYEFLSNFFRFDQPIYDNYKLPYFTVENAFQAFKTTSVHTRMDIQRLPPGKAKIKGRQVALREDWEDIKIAVMLQFLLQKFLHNPELSVLLLETQDRRLIEGNTWNGRFWGVCNGHGENHLGRLLMHVRTVLRGDSL